MIEKARVLKKLPGKKIEVELLTENCSRCGLCAGASSKTARRLIVADTQNSRPGETVELAFPSLYRIALFLFGLPLGGFILVVWALERYNSGVALLGGLLGMAGIYIACKKSTDKMQEDIRVI